ncbi:MAG: hypothetical protein KKB47_06655, partial [Alphaproteobacteria bacterium]|nr:hypothetical protein [Alphaproteobacteria bacterium]
MSMDFNGRESENPITDQEGVMFAAQPVWDRNRKRKGFGGRKTAAPAAPIVTTVVTPEPRSFAAERDYEAPMALDRPISTPEKTFVADEPVGLAAPIGGTRNVRAAKSNSVAPAAIAAAVVGLGALAAGGWYMSRAPEGVPELAAGSATTSEMAAAPLTPIAPPAQMAANEAL